MYPDPPLVLFDRVDGGDVGVIADAGIDSNVSRFAHTKLQKAERRKYCGRARVQNLCAERAFSKAPPRTGQSHQPAACFAPTIGETVAVGLVTARDLPTASDMAAWKSYQNATFHATSRKISDSSRMKIQR